MSKCGKHAFVKKTNRRRCRVCKRRKYSSHFYFSAIKGRHYAICKVCVKEKEYEPLLAGGTDYKKCLPPHQIELAEQLMADLEHIAAQAGPDWSFNIGAFLVEWRAGGGLPRND